MSEELRLKAQEAVERALGCVEWEMDNFMPRKGEGGKACERRRLIDAMTSAMLEFALIDHLEADGMVLVPQSLIEAAIDTYEGEWGRANRPDHWTNEARKLIGLSALPVLGVGR